ncbi:TPA: hypothetical protein OUD07_003739 [Morganella morganii]|nr:hypothetical protein [Morganella morganii]HCT9735760.1 hypothetical protein [Morganella morganii]
MSKNVVFFITLFISFSIIGFMVYVDVTTPEPTEYQIKRGLDKVNNFISKCENPYKITIADDNYRVSCDAGYVTVKPYVVEAFEKK